jgi:hypothetical protein
MTIKSEPSTEIIPNAHASFSLNENTFTQSQSIILTVTVLANFKPGRYILSAGFYMKDVFAMKNPTAYFRRFRIVLK